MRNMRGALWALGLAGAAYAWKNRGQLQQLRGGVARPNMTPQQLPDYSSNTTRQDASDNAAWEQPRGQQQFNGTEV